MLASLTHWLQNVQQTVVWTEGSAVLGCRKQRIRLHDLDTGKLVPVPPSQTDNVPAIGTMHCVPVCVLVFTVLTPLSAVE